MCRKTNPLRKWLSLAFIMMMLSGFAGCRYLSIPASDDATGGQMNPRRGNTSPTYNSAVIKGTVSGAGAAGNSTLILAYRPQDEKKEYKDGVVANSQGSFMLYLPQGEYQLFAITDYNRNGIFENDEVSGLYGSDLQPEKITLQEGDLKNHVVIRTARANSSKIILPLEWHEKENQKVVRQTTYNGQILKVYDESFSPENAQIGYWNPSSFMKAYGAHIYQSEAYHPQKIPILFVHGTEGSPHNWIYFYMRLDRSRYQPWFFYYPSGIRLPLAAALLNEELRELHEKYGFRRMGVVAHSVGGLTTRFFLTRYPPDGQNDFVKLFVTLATPWSGFGAADASQVIVHKSIPAWIDMGTQSSFIKTSLEEKPPPHIKHYIFYGKNDKLSGEKALDERAVAFAVKTFGFDCTHDSILSDRKVFVQFKTVLEKELR